MKRLISALVTTLIILSGCERSPEQKDKLSEAYQRIDREEYDSAIEILNRLMETDDRPHVRMALASAYAGRAGLRIESFWDFVKELRSGTITMESVTAGPFYQDNVKKIEPIVPYIPEKTRNDYDQVIRMMAAFDAYHQRLLLYPYVKKEKRGDLDTAVHVLTNVENRGGLLYRAILNSVIVRSELDEGFDVWKNIQENFSDVTRYPLRATTILCDPVTGDLTTWLAQQFTRSQMISNDLQAAFPSDANQYQVFSTQIEDSQSELPRLSAELVPGGCHE